MDYQIPQVLKNIIGLECWKAQIGYADKLSLSFGEQIIEKKLLSEEIYFSAEWEILTHSAMWRVLKKGKLICGNYGEDFEKQKLVKESIKGKLLEIKQLSPFDIAFYFENDLQVEFIPFTTDNDEFCWIYGPNSVYLELTKNGWKSSSSDDEATEYTAYEEKLRQFTESSAERWKKHFPPEQFENRCIDCAYFVPLGGRFSFLWEGGVCSNKKSPYDGLLVGETSGCWEFSDEIELE